MKNIILFSIIILFSLGCSNKDLDRKKAEALITEFYNYPNVEFLEVSNTWPGNQIPESYNRLIQDNYLTFKNQQWRMVFFLTPKAQPFLKDDYSTYSFVGNEIHFKEVTGIKMNENKNNATVFYNTVRRNITPIAVSYGRTEVDTEEHEIQFELFDDGWRVRSKRPEIIFKPSDFKVLDKDYVNRLIEISNEISFETTQSPCIINNVYEKNGQTFITVDFIQRQWVEKGGMEGFEIVNTNPKLRTFLINTSTVLIPVLNIEDLKKYIATKNYTQDFDIVVENGIVIRLQRNDAG